MPERSDSFWSAHYPPAPRHWIETARRTPALARLLYETLAPSTDGSPERYLTWIDRFLRFPPWQRIADRLRDLGECACDREVATLRLAALAETVAVQTAWCTSGAAYWHALTTGLQEKDQVSDLQQLEPARRARLVASWLWCTIAPGLPDVMSPFPVPEVPSDRIVDILREIFPQVDWPLLVEEAKQLQHLPIDHEPLDATRQQLLISWAQQLALEEELSLRNDVYQLSLVDETEPLLRQAVALLARTTDGPVAIWVAPLQSNAVGCGAVSSWQDRVAHHAASYQSMDREVFELTLPGQLRACHEVRDTNGKLTEAFYLRASVEPAIRRWCDAVSLILGKQRERAHKLSNHRASQRSVTEVASQIQRIERDLTEAIAEFSAGAGHEINNPLGAILGQAQWLLQEEEDPKRRHSLQKIADQVGRIRRMIRDLRLIGRPHPPRTTEASLATALSKGMAAAAKRVSGATLSLSDDGEAIEIDADPEELSRCFEELIVNGMEAAGPNGQVTVRCARDASGEAVVEISDSGPGFTAETRRHAYTPFYSGRAAGRGLGMGLAVAKRIASDIGGRLVIEETRPTTVRVVLPVKRAQRSAA